MNVRLVDISKETGFSVNTVSRALRNDKRISDSTTLQIKKVAEKLGYIPNNVASSMRSQFSNIIGVISPDSSNPFFSEVIRGIEVKAREINYHILLANSEEAPEQERDLIKMFLSRQVDGVISMPVFTTDPEQLDFYKRLPVPFVFAGRWLHGFEDHCILHSDRLCQKEVFDYLLTRGNKKILYIAGPDCASNTSSRLQGVKDSLSEHNLDVDDKYIIQSTGHVEDGYAIVNNALNRGLEFNAIACFNDLVALGALKSLFENDFSVPDEIEVFGFDNLYLSQFFHPSLSTVEVPKFMLGYSSMEELVKHIQDIDFQYQQKELSTRLIFRQTTK